MTLQELAVAAGQRVPIKIALLNNEYLGMVRQQQQVQYRGNLVEVDLAGAPDYIKLAQAYGVPAWRATRPEQLDDTIGAAMAYPGPSIIEFRVARAEDVYPWVLGGTSLGEVLPDTPYEARRERALAGASPSPKDGSDR
jgi:acetolactate synthase-1/2/3 large subunit